MKQLAQCTSLVEVRDHIDRIDRQMVALMAERGAYVRQAAGFKKSVEEVPAPKRVAEVLAKVGTMARETGADPTVVQATWQAMICAFIQAEHEAHAALHPPSPTKN